MSDGITSNGSVVEEQPPFCEQPDNVCDVDGHSDDGGAEGTAEGKLDCEGAMVIVPVCFYVRCTCMS